jgi:hypothetical protein
MSSELTECVTETLSDAQGAHLRIRALLELLRGCPPDYPLSAGLFIGLIESVRERMDNVVDGLQVVHKNAPETAWLN